MPVLFSIVWACMITALLLLPAAMAMTMRLILPRLKGSWIATIVGVVAFSTKAIFGNDRRIIAETITHIRRDGDFEALGVQLLLLLLWLAAFFAFPWAIAWWGISIGNRIIEQRSPQQGSEGTAPR